MGVASMLIAICTLTQIQNQGEQSSCYYCQLINLWNMTSSWKSITIGMI